jgi:glycine/D-amino acid oxidase-like deaminating enzyme
MYLKARATRHQTAGSKAWKREQSQRLLFAAGVVLAHDAVIGCSISYYLSLRRLPSTIVEQTGVASAASGKAGGFLAKDWTEGPLSLLCRRSFDMHAQLAELFGKEYGFRVTETLQVSLSKRKKERDSWIDAKVDIAPIGSVKTTCQVDPYQFTNQLMEEACANGSQVRIGSVTGVKRSSGKVTAVLVDNEEVPCDIVVIAMGPWTHLVKKWINIPEVSCLRAHSIVLRPSIDVPGQVLFTSGDSDNLDPEIVPRPDGMHV